MSESIRDYVLSDLLFLKVSANIWGPVDAGRFN